MFFIPFGNSEVVTVDMLHKNWHLDLCIYQYEHPYLFPQKMYHLYNGILDCEKERK